MYLFIYSTAKLASKHIKWLHGLPASHSNVKNCKIKLREHFSLKFFFSVVHFIFARDPELVMHIYGLNLNKMA